MGPVSDNISSLIITHYAVVTDKCVFLFVFLQCLHSDDGSKPMMKFREPDYAGQYSPWSCETIGSYIGTKDAKPKDVMVTVPMDMMVRADTE